MSLAQGNNTPTRPRIEPGSPPNSAFWRSLEVNFEVYMKFTCSDHGVNLMLHFVLAQLYLKLNNILVKSEKNQRLSDMGFNF